MINSNNIIIPITLLSIFATTFVIININPIINKFAKVNVSNNELINTNHAPLARSVEKLATVNSTFHTNLFSLTTDIDVDNLAYFKIIELPDHGILSVHSEFNEDVKYFEYKNKSDPNNKKFDGHFLYIKYTPSNDFKGKDYFKYIVVDDRGEKSNEATVTVSYADNIIIKNNHKPVALNTSIKKSLNVPVTVDIQSLTYDLDGDFIHVKTNKNKYPNHLTFSGYSSTLMKRVHGITLGQYYFHYIPSSIGEENIRYEIWDKNNSKNSSFGFINYKILPSTATPIKYRLKEVWILIGLAIGVVLFFPLSKTVHLRIRWLKGAGGIILIAGTSIMSKELYTRINYADNYLFRFSVTFFIYLSILMIIIGICLLNTKRIETWRVFILKIGDRYLFLIMIMLLNSAILLYHYTITIPPKALDTWGYVALYNFFKYDIYGYTVPEHHTRILVPYLASILPIDNIWISFKFVTVAFLNFSVLILCWTWKKLDIKNYLIIIGIVWMSFHQYGAVRFQNIYATDINISTYFFYAFLVYTIYTKRYWGLLFIAPFAVLQREVILFYILALLVFHIYSFIVTKYMSGFFKLEQKHLLIKVRHHQNAVFFIFCAIFLCIAALQIPSYINPQPYDMIGASILAIIYILSTQPLSLYLTIIMFFINYCGLLLLGVLNLKNSFRNDDMFICMTIFIILNIISSTISPNYRFQTFVYPFIMTLILISINNMNLFTVFTGILLSLPFMGIKPNPIFLYSPHPNLGIMETPMGYVNALGIFMIIIFLVLHILESSSLPTNITTIFLRKSWWGAKIK